jgi:hypothetical protein
LDLVERPEDFTVNIKGIPRMLAKMQDNELKKVGLRLFDTIRASVYFQDESQFVVAFKRL